MPPTRFDLIIDVPEDGHVEAETWRHIVKGQMIVVDFLLLDKMLHNQTIGRNRLNIKSFTNICKEVKTEFA